MPTIINRIEVFIDFHIFAILEFDLLIVYPLDKLSQVKTSYGSLNKKLGTTASATPIPCPECPKAKQQPNHNLFEEENLIFPFVSPKLAYETEQSSSPSLEPKPCPSGHPNFVLNGQDSTLIVHDVSLKKENSCAMDNPATSTLETKDTNSTGEHKSFSFETPHVPCSLLESLEFVLLKTTSSYEDPNHLLLLVSKLFKRMVVDAFVYHKYCKSHSCTVALTLQLEHYC